MKVRYSANNSGGSWWLSDEQWRALDAAGWNVEWASAMEGLSRAIIKDGRYMGALAIYANRNGLTLGQAIREWESVTGLSSSELGCPCCGPPHVFTLLDDQGKHVESYSPEPAYYGNAYTGE